MVADFSLSPRMRRILERAEELARGRGMTTIGTEHVMLALLDDPKAIATMALGKVVDPARVQEEIQIIIQSESYGRTPPNSTEKARVSAAMRESSPTRQ